VVLAMGCRERTRAQIRLPGSRPAGVYTAGTAQRWVNVEGYMPGKNFVILGSGDIGMIMARRLTLEGAKVERVLEIMPFLTGLTRNYVQCLLDFDIPLQLNAHRQPHHRRKRVEAIESVRVDERWNPIKGTEEIIPCDTLLLSVGLIPENELSRKAGVRLDPLTGGPYVDDGFETNVPGVFAAGQRGARLRPGRLGHRGGLHAAGKSAAQFAIRERQIESAATCRCWRAKMCATWCRTNWTKTPGPKAKSAADAGKPAHRSPGMGRSAQRRSPGPAPASPTPAPAKC
jgi:NADPH-dependent 2,4-dienoyl-CoA reductase/sulfur reductase-like enzyme